MTFYPGFVDCCPKQTAVRNRGQLQWTENLASGQQPVKNDSIDLEIQIKSVFLVNLKVQSLLINALLHAL